MEEQKQKLMTALMLVVFNLKQTEGVKKAIRELGARHVRYGILAQYYPKFGSVLLTTLEQYLGSDWTPDMKQAWLDAYNNMTDLMVQGAGNRNNYTQSGIVTTAKAMAKESISLQLTPDEKIILEQYCQRTQSSPDDVLREFIRSLQDRRSVVGNR